MHGRLNVILIPQTELPYLINKNVNKLYISSKDHSHYERKLLVTKNNFNMMVFLNKKITELNRDQQWKNLLAKVKGLTH